MILFTGDYYGIFSIRELFVLTQKFFYREKKKMAFRSQQAEEVEILQKNNYFL